MVYTQLTDFLDLLKDERGAMRLYLGQCIGFEDDADRVAETLTTFELDETQFSFLIRSFAWENLDLLNQWCHPTTQGRRCGDDLQAPRHQPTVSPRRDD